MRGRKGTHRVLSGYCEGCLLRAPHSLMVKLYKHALTPLLPPDLKLKADGTLAPTTPVSTLTVLNCE
jgi:hypothetical protein